MWLAREKVQWRGVRLESSRREMRFSNSFQRPFLIAGPAATQMRVPLAALVLGERQSTSAFAGKLTGRNIPSSATPSC